MFLFSFRVIWCLLFCFAIYYGYLLYTPFLNTWFNEPTLIGVDQADFPVEKIPFPAITICSNNKIVYRQLESVLRKQPWKARNELNYNITEQTDKGTISARGHFILVLNPYSQVTFEVFGTLCMI